MAKVIRKSSTKTFKHVFEDSGVEVLLRKTNPFISSETRTELNKLRPKPPVRIVTEDGPLKGREETMEHDPDYIAALRKFEAEVDQKIMQLQIKRGVVEIKVEGWQEEVAQLRADLAEVGAANSLPADDMVVYICYIAASTADDLQEFVAAIASRSQPTQEATDAAKETFRADLS